MVMVATYEEVEAFEITVHDLWLPRVEIIDGLYDLTEQVEGPFPVPVDVFPLQHVQEAAQLAKLEGDAKPWPHAHPVEAHDARTLHQTAPPKLSAR